MVVSDKLQSLIWQGNAILRHVPIGAAPLATIHCPKGKALLLLNVKYHYYIAVAGENLSWEVVQASNLHQQLTLIERGGAPKFNQHYRVPINVGYDANTGINIYTLSQSCENTETFCCFKQDIILELINCPYPSTWTTSVGSTTAASQEPVEPIGQGTATAVRNALHEFSAGEFYYPTTQFRLLDLPYTAASGYRDEFRFNVSSARKDTSYTGLTELEPYSYPIVELTIVELSTQHLQNL